MTIIKINDLDISKLNIDKLDLNSNINKNLPNQVITFVNYDGNSSMFATDIITCNWDPVSKFFIDECSSTNNKFKLYNNHMVELETLFNKFNEIDKKIINNKENILESLKDNKIIEQFKYQPIIKCSYKDSNKNNYIKTIYDEDYINIKLKYDNQKKLQTKIMLGSIINNKFIGNQLDDVNNILDLKKKHIFTKGCQFRLLLKIKKIWFNKKYNLGNAKFGTIIECIRLDIIENNKLDIDNDILNHIKLSNCQNIIINGEKKKVYDIGNGLLKIIDEKKIYNNDETKFNKIVNPSKNNINESNINILNILNKS